MKTPTIEKAPAKRSPVKKLLALLFVVAVIVASILIINLLPAGESEFVDNVAQDIEQEMDENHIVLSSRGIRRTVADFQEPIVLNHRKDSHLIVHTAHLSETISIADEGLGGWAWTSIYQDIVFEGDAQYTIDLSQLSEDDFMVNNEKKKITKEDFGRIMHDPNSTQEEIDEALAFLQDCDGYENLPD
jgi:hypothetical protein